MTTQMTARKTAPVERPTAPTLSAVPKAAPVVAREAALAPAPASTDAPAAAKAVPTAPRAATVAPAAQATTAPEAAPAPALASRVELVQLSKATWRVCDAAMVPGGRGYIVGYLQQMEQDFEMLWMHPRPGVVHRYDAFDEAVRAIAIRLRMSAK